MSALSPVSRVLQGRRGVTTVGMALCMCVLGMAAACTPGGSGGGVGLTVQAAVTELEQGRARGVLTVSGIVTDDDPTADQTLLADEGRGILLSHAPWTSRPAPGTRVVVEGQLRMVDGAVPTMTVSRVLSTQAGTLPRPLTNAS